tara:strand:- start:48 stop:899 length:852 start_codon:yes stop_codon:yes gene_type:complete
MTNISKKTSRNRYVQLISMHKSGSTWVQSYIHKAYRRFGVTLPPSNLYNEFFTEDEWAPDTPIRENSKTEPATNDPFIKRSMKKRIALVTELRNFGLELAHKAHVPEIISIWPWFKTFYKDHNILVLKRRHMFTHWLAILFYDCIKLATGPDIIKGNNKEGYTYITPSKIENPRAEDIIKSTIQEYKVEFKFNEICWNNFVNNIRFLNDVVIEELDKPQIIWTEDITTEWLEDYFKVVLKKLPTPFTTFEFKTYFKPEDMKIIREIFEERFYNEFQYYGYELK